MGRRFPRSSSTARRRRGTSPATTRSPRPKGRIADFSGDYESMRARAYDLVLNGVEIGGGSIRIHEKDEQMAMFRLLNIKEEEAVAQFGFLLEALEMGAPPHGGIAFGVDRILMMLLGLESIRDVIPFPKTQKGACLLSGAPAPVKARQLGRAAAEDREGVGTEVA